MAWKKQLRKASFKGVSFFVSSTDGKFGRSVVVHQFPKKSSPFAEDIGKKADEFSIEAFIIGEDYFADRDALLEVCSEEGGGDLIHPYLGKKFVVCTGITLRESQSEGGIARLTLSFVETTAPVEPLAILDFFGKVASAASRLRQTVTSKFDSVFSVVGYATSVVDGASSAVGSVVDELESAQKTIRGDVEKISELAYKVRKLKAQVGSIVSFPSRISSLFDDAFLTLAGAFGGGKEAAKALSRFAQTTSAIDTLFSTPGATASISQIKSNAEQVDILKKTLAATYRADALIEAEFSSLDDAVENREALIEDLESLMEFVDDETFQAIQDLRISILRAIPNPEQDLSRLVSVEITGTLPSLAVEYDLRESLDLEEDLIARNGIGHPGFIPSGTVLKVIQND